MGWFDRRKKVWDLASVEPPWTGATSIYAHLQRHIVPGARGLTEGGARLPDEPDDDGSIRWSAGALDGAMGHHFGGAGGARDRAALLHRGLEVVLKDATTLGIAQLYQLMRQGAARECVDRLLERIVEKQALDAPRLGALARWIAANATDREPVKLAIALLGLAGGAEDRELLMTLGRHEEFTLYVAVALGNSAEARDPRARDRTLFELAQHVRGWGRIQIVERLAETEDATIRAWMVREGYRNAVMYEYLALLCATAGRLRSELDVEHINAELLTGAGEIIGALTSGVGPAGGLDDYDDGAAVVARYIHHLGAYPLSTEHLNVLRAIDGFLAQEDGWDERAARGWTPALRAELASRVGEVRAAPGSLELVTAELGADDPRRFSAAAEAARFLGLDPWAHHFARLEVGDEDRWYDVMRTSDRVRIERVVALAEARLPLDAIATGPADELGLGAAWREHGHLDTVVQDLGRFPGVGWPLIRTALRSPTVRNRNLALRALAAWPRDTWPPDARDGLERARADEPCDDVRDRIAAVLAGVPLDDS